MFSVKDTEENSGEEYKLFSDVGHLFSRFVKSRRVVFFLSAFA